MQVRVLSSALIMIIYRVRTIDIDGNKLGRTWAEELSVQKEEAEKYFMQKVSDENMDEILYKPDAVEGVNGYCNWLHGLMICYDSIKVE